MEQKFQLDLEKTLHSILFILEKTGGKCGFHKIFKILFFADQKHLVEYGRPVSGDRYIAMQDGPVPSVLYDIFKYLRGDSLFVALSAPNVGDFFEVVDHHYVIPKRHPDLEMLSETDIDALEASIAENAHLGFGFLSKKSHQSAWEKAKDNEMNALEIARDGGADEEMLKYIRLNMEIPDTLPHYAKFR